MSTSGSSCFTCPAMPGTKGVPVEKGRCRLEDYVAANCLRASTNALATAGQRFFGELISEDTLRLAA